MDTKEQLEQSREQFKDSVATAFRSFGDYGRAVGAHAGAVIKDKVVDMPARKAAEYYLDQEEKEAARLEEERIREEEARREEAIAANTREHEIGMREALREHDKQERRARLVAFKDGVIAKVSSARGKLGSLGTSLLEKLRPSNLDVKFRDFVETVEIKGLELASKGKNAVIEARDKIVDFAASKAADYYLEQEEKAKAKAEEDRIREEEARREEAIEANTREHEIGMREALREHDKQERRARLVAFKDGVIAKVSSARGKLGSLGTSLLEKLRPSNLDVKFRDFVETVEIKGLELASKGKNAVIEARDKIVDFAASKAADYYLEQEEKAKAKAEEDRIREEEARREEAIEANTREHEIGMREALREHDKQERRARLVAFKAGVVEKTDSFKSKLGSIKSAFLGKLSSAKDKVTDFFAEKAAEYHLRQEERTSAKEFREAARKVEAEEIAKEKERVAARKKDMIAALNADEREGYEQRHIDNVARKEELMKDLFGEPEERLEPVYRTI